MDINANSTHPDAKPREERERDDTIWCWSPMENGRFILTTANGFIIAANLSSDTARRLCVEHNRIALQ